MHVISDLDLNVHNFEPRFSDSYQKQVCLCSKLVTSQLEYIKGYQ